MLPLESIASLRLIFDRFIGGFQRPAPHSGCGIFTPSAACCNWLDSQHMGTNGLSVQVAGAITIALIVGLGIFVYPWLLVQRYGAWVVGLMTILLGALFFVLQGSDSSTYSRALAAGWALGPVIAAVIVRRAQRKSE
jgi:hypothetical protein